MQSLGHPILGDELYGDEASAPRLLLHAERLGFQVPGTTEISIFESPPDF
jgi:tRNA pseudouridine32 synthase/23S rRNA pseudouridine746 synthase